MNITLSEDVLAGAVSMDVLALLILRNALGETYVPQRGFVVQLSQHGTFEIGQSDLVPPGQAVVFQMTGHAEQITG